MLLKPLKPGFPKAPYPIPIPIPAPGDTGGLRASCANPIGFASSIGFAIRLGPSRSRVAGSVKAPGIAEPREPTDFRKPAISCGCMPVMFVSSLAPAAERADTAAAERASRLVLWETAARAARPLNFFRGFVVVWEMHRWKAVLRTV
jgi:hypothetical protein